MLKNVYEQSANKGQVIETGRLTLQPLSARFLSDIHNGFTDNVARYMHAQPDTIQETSNSISKRLQEVNGHYFVIVDNESLQFLGCAGIRINEGIVASPRLWIRESMWSQGYGREVLQALVLYIKEQFKINFIYCTVNCLNIRAMRVLELSGGVLQNHCFPNENARGQINFLFAYRFE